MKTQITTAMITGALIASASVNAQSIQEALDAQGNNVPVVQAQQDQYLTSIQDYVDAQRNEINDAPVVSSSTRALEGVRNAL